VQRNEPEMVDQERRRGSVQLFYRRCKQADAHIRGLRRARPAHWSACDIIGWASIISGPFLPVESLVAKAGVIVFGSALKLRCG
jgi:hypothetical protein